MNIKRGVIWIPLSNNRLSRNNLQSKLSLKEILNINHHKDLSEQIDLDKSIEQESITEIITKSDYDNDDLYRDDEFYTSLNINSHKKRPSSLIGWFVWLSKKRHRRNCEELSFRERIFNKNKDE